MKIAVCVPYSPAGGSFTRLSQLLVDLPELSASRGHTLVLLAQQSTIMALQNATGEPALEPYRVLTLRRDDPGMAARVWREEWELPRHLRRESIDVAFCTANTMPLRPPCPCVVLYQNAAPFCDFHGVVDWNMRLRFLLLGNAIRRSARNASYNIFTSDYLREAVLAAVPEARARSTVIGVPSSQLPAGSLELSEIPANYLLFVGHFYPYRHIVELLCAFDETGADTRFRHYRLVLAGGFRDPAYARRVRAAQRSLAFPERVAFIGEQSQAAVLQLIRGARGFVFLSTCESSPQALTEAVTLGCPILTTRAGVMPEISGSAAVYCNPASIAEIRTGMKDIMEDDGLCSRLAVAGRAKLAEFPDRREIAARVLDAIEIGARPRQVRPISA